MIDRLVVFLSEQYKSDQAESDGQLVGTRGRSENLRHADRELLHRRPCKNNQALGAYSHRIEIFF